MGSRSAGAHATNGWPLEASTSCAAASGLSPILATTCRKSSRNAVPASGVAGRAFSLIVDTSLRKPPFLHAPPLPGGGASAADQDVEPLATGGAQGGKLGQVQAVGQPHRAPAAAEQRRETLGGTLPRAVWIEDTIDSERLRERGQPFGWKVRAADREGRQFPAEGGEQ